MDPNACLAEIRALVDKINSDDAVKDLEYCGGLGAELAEKIDALDSWITRGGFIPREWDSFTGGHTSK